MSNDSHMSFQQIVHAMNVGITLFGTDYSKIHAVDLKLREQLSLEESYVKFVEVFQKRSRTQSLQKIRDSFHLYYYFYKAPEYSTDGRIYYCIGPILRGEMTAEEIDEVLTANGLTQSPIDDFFLYYNRVPVLENLAVFEKTLLAVIASIFGQGVSLQTLPEELLKVKFSGRTRKGILNTPLADTIESMYELENKMMDAVSVGDHELAKQLSYRQSMITFRSRMPNNPLREAKGRLIVLNVLLRKAIERAGVHPVYIDDISSRYSIRIEQAASTLELSDYSNRMIDEYCEMVRKRTVRNCHALIRNCIMYIEQHYSEELTLTRLANEFFVSRQYLSTLFKKETDINLTDYIQKCQMEHAARMLVDTRLSITEIASQCGHSNTAYFTKIFKKYYSWTPREYRKSASRPADGGMD